MLKRVSKTVAIAIATACMFPFAVLTGFGRAAWVFQFFAQLLAILPGLPGDYLRVAYYAMTLRRCSFYSRVSFGTFFAHSSATVSEGVFVGSYCVLGRCHIGERTQIASQVQILSGRHQHSRDDQGRINGAEGGCFTTVTVGANCWVGASAIIMADIGSGTTIGAGAVVTSPIPSNVIAVGNPARIVKQAAA